MKYIIIIPFLLISTSAYSQTTDSLKAEIVTYSQSKSFDTLYSTLETNKDLLQSAALSFYDSILYVNAMEFLKQEDYENFDRYNKLISVSSKYNSKIWNHHLYSEFLKYKANQTKTVNKEIILSQINPVLPSVQETISFYQNNIEGKNLTWIREFLYDEGFSRSFEANGESYMKHYKFDNIWFSLFIDVWHSYGHKRLFYDVKVSSIDYRSNDITGHYDYYTGEIK